MTEPVTPSIGWAVVHLFCKPTPDTDAERLWRREGRQSQEHLVSTAAILGHKADLCVWVSVPISACCDNCKTAPTGRTRRGRLLCLADGGERVREGHAAGMLDLRLYPPLPVEGKKFCFYPMSNAARHRPELVHVPYDDRERLMREHGASGRKFAGRITQLVTGSAGSTTTSGL